MSEPAPARQAATVLLLRDAEAGIEVHLQRRHAEMDFGARAWVFPGGSMDAADAAGGLAERLVSGDDGALGRLATRMALDGSAGRRRCAALWVCALRELFEEAGVLVADGPAGAPLPGEALAAARRRLLAGSRLDAELEALGATVELPRLVYVAHFVTPVGMPRRYDTRFFAARLPEGQSANAHPGEAVESGWFTAAAMLERADAGEALLMPPTRILLGELRRHGDVTALLADLGQRDVAGIMPRLDNLHRRPLPDHLPGAAEAAAAGELV